MLAYQKISKISKLKSANSSFFFILVESFEDDFSIELFLIIVKRKQIYQCQHKEKKYYIFVAKVGITESLKSSTFQNSRLCKALL